MKEDAAVGGGAPGRGAVGRGHAEKARGGGCATQEEEEEEEEELEMLEVDQILMSDLVGDLGEERSLNVTALLMADADALDLQAGAIRQ